MFPDDWEVLVLAGADNDIGLRPTILWLCHNDILHGVQNDIRRP